MLQSIDSEGLGKWQGSELWGDQDLLRKGKQNRLCRQTGCRMTQERGGSGLLGEGMEGQKVERYD